jgi:excisionase family DNA binding protein
MPALPSHVLKSITLFGLSQGTINLQSIAEVNMDALLSVTEAAKRLGGISKWTVHAWLSKGRLQRTKVGGRTMIRESELDKIIEDGGKSAAPRRRSAKTGEKR